MSQCWTSAPPPVPGYYEVRIRTGRIGETAVRAPAPRLAFVEPAAGRFDAGSFGGSIQEPFWEWRGPVEVPDLLPEELG